MPWPETVETVPMVRVALAGPAAGLRELLVVLADAGVAELETAPGGDAGEAAEALRRLRGAGAAETEPALLEAERPVAELEAAGRADLLAGEVQLGRRETAAVKRGAFAAAAAWCPRAELDRLRTRLEPLGGGIVELPRRPFEEPPTMLRTPRAASAFRPLVETYGTVRYTDVDPTLFTAVSFVLMFGMMFADAGEGLLLVAAGLALRLSRSPRLARLRTSWPLPVAAGLVATGFGLAYGEAFGPTGLVPALWLKPLRDPLRLLVAGVIVGAALLAISYVIGTVNRWRQGGAGVALYSTSGLAGALVFAGAGALVVSWWLHSPPWLAAGGALLIVGLVLMFAGLLAEAGGGVGGWLQALVELFNAVIRLGANSISFARLAAFGLVHAAIGELVWTTTHGLWAGGLWYAAILVFAAGTAVGFALELLVAAIQALRLEYYELFSRVYSGEGRAFVPWHVRVIKEES